MTNDQTKMKFQMIQDDVNVNVHEFLCMKYECTWVCHVPGYCTGIDICHVLLTSTSSEV